MAGSIIGGIIGGVGSIIGGESSADAAESAANAQYRAAREALDFQKEVYGDYRTDIQPYVDIGTASMNRLGQIFLGYDAGAVADIDREIARLRAGGSTTTGGAGGGTGTPGSGAGSSGRVNPLTGEPVSEYTGRIPVIGANVSLEDILNGTYAGAPYVEDVTQTPAWSERLTFPEYQMGRGRLLDEARRGGGAAGGGAGGTPGMTDEELAAAIAELEAQREGLMNAAAPDYSEFYKSPGYQFRLDEGEKALERSAAARGRLLSGATLKGINEYAQNFASGEFNNYTNRLAAMAGIGQTSVAGSGSTGLGFSGAIGEQLGNMGAARASGYVGASNARGQGYGNAFAQFGDAISQGFNSLGSSGGGSFYNPGAGTWYDSSSGLGGNAFSNWVF